MVVLCLLLMVACIYDYTRRRIPNVLILMIVASGLGRILISNGVGGIPGFLFRILFMVFILYPLFKIGVLGAGDVKLFGACAGFVCLPKIFLFLFVSLLIAALISFIKMTVQCEWFLSMNRFFRYVQRALEVKKWTYYFEDRVEQKKAGICLAGPVLGSILLYMGGIY